MQRPLLDVGHAIPRAQPKRFVMIRLTQASFSDKTDVGAMLSVFFHRRINIALTTHTINTINTVHTIHMVDRG